MIFRKSLRAKIRKFGTAQSKWRQATKYIALREVSMQRTVL